MEALTRPYEGIVIVHPDTPEEGQKEIFQRNKAVIEEFGGELHNLDTWGKRLLANPIKKNRQGIYFHATFKTNPEAIAEIERRMKIDERILRFFHQRLNDNTSLDEHLKAFKDSIEASIAREREKEAKFQKKLAARQARAAAKDHGE
jgi:small subunit ribosomal protein S6